MVPYSSYANPYYSRYLQLEQPASEKETVAIHELRMAVGSAEGLEQRVLELENRHRN